MITGIYKITNPNGKVYIGQSVDILKRFREYKKLRCKYQPKIYRSLLKYGVNSHIFEIVEECTREELSLREVYWGEFYNSIDEGLNLSLGFGPIIRSEETNKKISRANKGKTPWNKNKPGAQKHSKETRKKIASNRQGEKHSSTTRQKISDSHKESGHKPPSRKGSKWAPERRAKFLETLRKKKLSN